MKTPYFKLFASCIPVRGASKFVICDLGRSELYYIPEGVYEIIVEHKNKTIEEIKALYDDDLKADIDRHITALIDNELGFLTDEPENFPRLDLNWDAPNSISNAIIELDSHSNYDLQNVVMLLERLGCRHIELRVYHSLRIERLEELIQLFEETKVKNLVFIIAFEDSFVDYDWLLFLIKYQRIGTLVIHSSPSDFKPIGKSEQNPQLVITNKKIRDNSCCGVVSKEYFSINIPMFAESQNFNSCLNRKLTINTKGIIKNCPSLKESYGDVSLINYASIKSIVDSQDFQKYSHISKDQILICKDCEYRYICTDCRAFISNDDDILSKPSKCGYDPYLGVWNEV